MKPSLHGGDTVQLVSLSGTMPKIGEMIFFCDSQGNPLLHRLIRRYSYQGNVFLQTKGDACPGFDEMVPLCQVLGRVRQITCHSDVEPKKIISLESPSMRLNALIIVSYSRVFDYLRRVKIAFKKEGSP
ncbi:hypothetical protein KKHLCK_14515 [Candidatus Electrothrix laxa]